MAATVIINSKGHQIELMPVFVRCRFTFKPSNPNHYPPFAQNAIEQAESLMTQLEVLDLLLSSTSIHSHFHIISSENGVSIQSLDKKILALYDAMQGELMTFNHFEPEVAHELVKRAMNESIKQH
ncbi:hypothetical protein [Vibrio sp. 1291-1]|uniref:hypothetical protein n=1 Tax=Vibrio sp. 1291-1 TaxID=3074551 RepID=UPI00296B1391|nr:hypothetical protein [Vibrio sp. 1291-1]MDW3640251.1 hypothetical protein [Vibrio sp. 1291-1]